MDASREELEDAITHIVPDKPFPKYIDETVFLELQSLLGHHPDKVFSVWARENPRLFLLLRMLGCDDDALYQRLDSENIGDFWLPLGSATLNQLSSFTNISAQDWRRAQLHVLSQSDQMGEHKLTSPINAHRHIQNGSAHFEELEKIGKGGSAEVARVRHKLSGREYACKRIKRAPGVKIQRNQLIEFKAEVGVLRRVSHHHLVSFVASFTDLSSFSLILNPVAKDVLKSMLERQSRDQPLPERDVSSLRRAFGCLAIALAYLHKENVRHKDIKPGNILLSDGLVYLCDFGISRAWSKAEHSTTEDEVLKLTPRYCAPEVMYNKPRNTGTDVWSLGCVFLEMISVVKGYPIEELNNFLLKASDDQSSRGLWWAMDAMTAWMEHIRSEKNDSADDIPLGWITTMIRSKKEDRIIASGLAEMISKASGELESPDSYIGPCCTRSDNVILANSVDSPILHDLAVQGLGEFNPNALWIARSTDECGTPGIHNAPTSPIMPNLLGLPDRPSSASSRERSSNTPSIRHSSEDRTRSISSYTKGIGPGDSVETAPFRTDSNHSRSTGPSLSKPLEHIASRTDSFRTSSHLSPPRADSEAASFSTYRLRSPVPPPAQYDVECSCAALPEERHIFNMPYASRLDNVPFNPEIPTAQTWAKCEIGEDRIQVYETYRTGPENSNTSAMPMLWWSTRRLVISHVSGQPKMRHCSSFWLPLADIQFRLRGSTVILRWSDCNHMTERTPGNWVKHYDWVYNPNSANNSFQAHFNTPESAQKFVDIVRLPYEDEETITNVRRINVSDSTELNIFHIGRPGVRNYRAATLTFVNDSWATSKLYIQWPEVDLDIHVRDSFDARSAATTGYEMVVEMKNVTTPTYHSDTRGEPAANDERVARFSSACLLKTSLAVAFQIGVEHGLPTPPDGTSSIARLHLTAYLQCANIFQACQRCCKA
jgi:serine/threonine protein kinase